jgi:glycosyltransferase involved in cell wall biosynthesis
VIYIFTQYFTPAFKAGGPITSIANILSKVEGDFKVVSRGHDLNDPKPLDVQLNCWTNSSKNWYVSNGISALLSFYKELKKQQKQIFYINGLFDWKLNLLPILCAKKIIVAPRGMLQKGALANGSIKKGFYLAVLRVLLRGKDLKWHATDKVEAADIKLLFGKQEVSIIPNLIKQVQGVEMQSKKQVGHLNLVYYSLLSEKKNLLFLLQLLELSNGSFQLHVYGPDKDPVYAEKCKQMVRSSATLASKVIFQGALLPTEFEKLAHQFDYFVLPTLGENYGHAIVESLALGLPVLISDKTPWLFEENSFSYSLGLHSEQEWKDTLHQLFSMDAATHLKAKAAALLFYQNQIESKQEKYIDSYKNLFFASNKL